MQTLWKGYRIFKANFGALKVGFTALLKKVLLIQKRRLHGYTGKFFFNFLLSNSLQLLGVLYAGAGYMQGNRAYM